MPYTDIIDMNNLIFLLDRRLVQKIQNVQNFYLFTLYSIFAHVCNHKDIVDKPMDGVFLQLQNGLKKLF